MNDSFRSGAKEGFGALFPLSLGLIPWAMVTGVAMRSTGLSVIESMGMNLLVFAGTAQLGTLPLIGSGAPLWLIVLTALVLNLRFVIFSAALAPAFDGQPLRRRLLTGYLLVDGVFAVLSERLLKATDPHWRWGCFIAPAAWCWVLWQVFAFVGVIGAGVLPSDWSLEFMATIALLVMLVPMAASRPMLVAALVGGIATVLLRGMPLKLGLVAGIALGIVAGFVAERWQDGRGRA
ncbi:MAG TPA: AzlC family ABC transporter permease [Rhodocyclaceae bacterium]|nr:AzlC family ABC transporter permease [Rhodocyclaceae bacterium]